MLIQWPLVLFSLVAGTGGAVFACVALSEILGGSQKTRTSATVVSLALIVVGGCLSMIHLASPLHAVSAITNIFSFSGISIELMLLGICFVVMAAYYIVRKREGSEFAAKTLAIIGLVFGLMLGFFCGHGYLLESQPTWNTDMLPLAYLGTSLACGAFLFDIVSQLVCPDNDGEVGGHAPLLVLVCAVLGALGIVAYAAFLGFDVLSNQGIVFWGGAMVVGVVMTVGCGLARQFGKRQLPAVPVSVVGLVCAFVGGIAIRALMWLCATGYLDLFSHTVPSVMLNL